MDNNNSRTLTLSGGTMGFITFIVFLILKLTNTWNVSWFWVFFPLWIPIAVGIAFIIIALIIYGIAGLFER